MVADHQRHPSPSRMPPTAAVAQFSILPLTGIKSYTFESNVPVIHVGVLVSEVRYWQAWVPRAYMSGWSSSILQGLRAFDDLYLCRTYTP
jgi:hypothetical protein